MVSGEGWDLFEYRPQTHCVSRAPQGCARLVSLVSQGSRSVQSLVPQLGHSCTPNMGFPWCSFHLGVWTG